ncbi:enoyl-CoA hydratase/isomerase family protein [Pararoseomonas sp. SCSIO 73927]|uniref:enoyl-CoA hydratase/isomerase family protein n=1 Tax=Pararoseomonas sp. SCSIO 73927 TaxID=3114537 RepID=UPI0030D23948
MPADTNTFRRSDAAGVARIVFDNPPLNLVTPAMIGELTRLFDGLRSDTATRVVVFDSADPVFFIGHADLTLFLEPRDAVPPKSATLNPLQNLLETLRTLPQATVAMLDGRAVGIGPEFLTSCDMAFASDRSVLLQFEAAMGVVPGATGSQRLPRLLGRMRALEVILGCDEIPADLAERYGLINRAFPQAELRPFVERLARRIATFPAKAITLNKVAVDAADGQPLHQGLLEEAHALNQALVGGEAQRRMKAFLDLGAQTPEFERQHFAAALDKLQA